MIYEPLNDEDTITSAFSKHDNALQRMQLELIEQELVIMQLRGLIERLDKVEAMRASSEFMFKQDVWSRLTKLEGNNV